jgi:hypothetical protein
MPISGIKAYFINGSTNRSIIDLHVSDNTGLIDDEQSSQRGTVQFVFLVFDQNTVVSGDILGDISQQWEVQLSNTTLGSKSQISTEKSKNGKLVEKSRNKCLPWGLDPGEMSEVGIDGNTDNASVQSGEFLGSFGESDQFSWADVGEIEWVEKKD